MPWESMSCWPEPRRPSPSRPAWRCSCAPRRPSPGGHVTGSGLLRLRRVREEREGQHDAQHAEHSAHLRAVLQAGRVLRGGPSRPVRPASGKPTDAPGLGRGTDSRFSRTPDSSPSPCAASTTVRSRGRTDRGRRQAPEARQDQGFLIDGGYGKIKGTTFRISNMGDETPTTMAPLIAALDAAMKQLDPMPAPAPAPISPGS